MVYPQRRRRSTSTWPSVPDASMMNTRLADAVAGDSSDPLDTWSLALCWDLGEKKAVGEGGGAQQQVIEGADGQRSVVVFVGRTGSGRGGGRRTEFGRGEVGRG